MNQLAQRLDRFARTAGNLARPAAARAALLLCAYNLFGVALFSQTCSDVAVPATPTLTSGTLIYQAATCISADRGFIVNGANVTFKAGSTIHLGIGFDAKAPSSGIGFDALISPGVTPPFSFSVTPSSQSTVQGGSAQYQVTMSPAFSGTVALSAQGLPPGASAAFSPASLTGGGSSYLTLATNNPNTPQGSYTITLTGTSGSYVEPEKSVTLTVTPPIPPPPATLPTSTTVIPFGWNSPAETLMFTTNTDSSYAPSYFSLVIENAGTYNAHNGVFPDQACYIYYDASPSNPTNSALYLWSDNWPSNGSWVNPGGSQPGTIPPSPVQNSHCRVDVSRSWVQIVGTQMTLQLALTFTNWSGPKEIFVDTADANSPRSELSWTNRGSWTVPNSSLIPVTTDHYDVFRTGANVHETTLTTSNAGNLHLAGTISLPGGPNPPSDNGCMWAQPLYVPNVAIRGGSYDGQTKNVLYVATANANVYAYDADAYVLLWSRALGQNNLGPSLGGAIPPPPATVGNGGDTDLVDCNGSSTVGSESGIVGTPAIDLSSNTMYVVGNLYVNSTVNHYLFGIDISSGLDSLGPRAIVSSGNVPSAFTPVSQLQRAGLLLADYTVLVPYGSYGDHVNGQSNPPFLYQGWMFGFNRGNLGLLDNGSYGTNTDGYVGAGIWMAGGGPAFDGTSVYFATGNNFGNQNSIGFSNSVLQVNPYGGPPPGTPNVGLAQIKQFMPPQATSSAWTTNPGDLDLGCSRVIVVPGTNDLLVGGKAGNVYVVDRGSLSSPPGSQAYVAAFNVNPDEPLQVPDGTTPSGLWAGLAYWKGSVYTWGGGSGDKVDYLRALTLDGTEVASNRSSMDHAYEGIPISISASFDDATTGLVWAVVPTLNGDPTNGDPHSASDDPTHFVTGQLQVYKASDLSLIHSYNLYNLSGSTYNIMKFTPPLVANGKVYVVTANQKILVFAP